MLVQFGRDFLADPNRAGDRRAWFERIAATDRRGALRTADAVIRRPDFSTELGRVRVPTLIVVGEADRATPTAEARRLHVGIAGLQLVVVPRAGHAVTVEQPDAVTHALDRLLARIPKI